ncbi:MAG: YitT family protein [Treponema sp.]|nr:YitT family protein [Treponema sp.]MCL2250682.1 YitT family protein [Treponema sp.]
MKNNFLQNQVLQTARRLFLVLAGAVLMAFNINTFVNAGGLLPGGFMGLTLLLQEIFSHYWQLTVSFSVIYYILNAVPAAFCFIFIGKKFTLYSILMVFVCGILTDWMPSMFTSFLTTHDILLSSVFGGLLNALAISLCLHADAASGGTDFIAIFISEKYHKDAWNYIFGVNCVILAAAGILFGLDRALYSIIFQFTTTMSLKVLYKNYQQRTLLIITNKPDDISKMISHLANHGATLIDCFGSYEKDNRTLLYSVVTATQIKKLIPAIKQIDPEAFINVLKTYQLNGRFYQRPKD